MRFVHWLFGGIVGGALGGSVWVAIEYSTRSEFAWMAWPVGLLVGWGVRKCAAADSRGGILRGAMAALLALAAVVGAGWSKAEILTKQAAVITVPADAVAQSEDNNDTVEEVQKNIVGTVDTLGSQNADLEGQSADLVELRAGVLHETTNSKSRSTYMDILWLCLAAMTAYVVGRGTQFCAVAQEESSQEGLNREEPAQEESEDME